MSGASWWIGVGISVTCVLLTGGLRMLPRLRCRHFGIDTWYYLTYARAIRRSRCWPVTLPYYLLDEPQQIYPPGLPWVLSQLPTAWLERHHWWLSAAVDAVHSLLVCLTVYVLSHSWPAAAAAGLLFATSPVLVSQATELNARPFATLLFSAFMAAVFRLEHAGGGIPMVAVLLVGMAILWTHKMTAQQMVAVLLAWSLLHRTPFYLLLGIGMVSANLVLSRGWFVNVLRSHRDIVRFWRHRLALLGAHQIYHSPLYGDPDKAERKRGVAGVRASAVHRWLAKGHVALIGALILGIGVSGGVRALYPVSGFFVAWALCVFATVFVTTWIPGLTQFGEGFKYLRYGVLPWSVLLGCWVAEWSAWGGWILLFGLVAVQSLVTLRMIRAQTQNTFAAVDENMRAVMQELAGRPEDGVLALPFAHGEAIAYFCEKRVLWGAHGGGWDRLEPFWPIMRKPIESFFKEYDLHWLWVDSRYVDLEDLRCSAGTLEPWRSQGSIQLFRFDAQRAGSFQAAEVARALS